MNNIIKNLILFIIFALSQNAYCAVLSSDELHNIIYNEINSETKKQLGDIEYKIRLNSALSDVSANDSQALKVEISHLSDFSPVSYRRVTIKDSKGNIIKTFPLNVQILIYKDVLVALDNIEFGKNIDKTNTKLEKKEVSKIYDKVLTQIPENSISSRNIYKNSIIQKNSIKQKAIISKNQNVDIVFQGRGIQVALKGKALNEGALGDVILVRSEKYNKTYSGIINSNSKVTVRI